MTEITINFLTKKEKKKVIEFLCENDIQHTIRE